MSHPLLSFRALFSSILLLVGGCAGSPDPVFYALSSQTGRALAGPALNIELRRVGLPSYLDRPHIVRRASAERLELAADERWGAPLDQMVSATLADDLGGRLPSCVVFSETGSIAAAADVRVEIEISRFELGADGTVRLQAGSAIRWSTSNDAVRLQRHTFTLQAASKSTANQVSSLSRVLAQLADAIAQSILQGPPLTTKATEGLTPAEPVIPSVPVVPKP